MNVTPNMRAAAVASVLSALGMVAIVGISVLGPAAPSGFFVVHLDGGAPPNCALVEADVLITSAGFALMHIDSGSAYGFSQVEVSADDAGVDAHPGDSLAGGAFVISAIYGDAKACPADAGQIMVWLQSRPDIPARCGCPVPDSGVMALVQTAAGAVVAPAVVGNTLHAGDWLTDAGAVLPKVCTEMGADVPSFPAGCLP